MSIPLIVNGQTFNYPSPGEPSGWGEDCTAWASQVTSTLSSVSGTGDISLTSTTIANNQTSAINVTSLAFDTTVVRGAEIQYTISRSGTVLGSPVVQVEEGRMHVVYNGTSWELNRTFVGDANVEFSVTNAGQFQYTSLDLGSGSAVTGYVGTMKFAAKAISQ